MQLRTHCSTATLYFGSTMAWSRGSKHVLTRAAAWAVGCGLDPDGSARRGGGAGRLELPTGPAERWMDRRVR